MSNYLLNILDVVPCLPGFAFCKDVDLTFVGCNESFSEATGFGTINKAIGKRDCDVTTFLMNNNFQEVLDADKQVLESGEPLLEIRETHKHPNGKTQMVITNKYPLLNNHTEVTGIFGIYFPLGEESTQWKQLSLIHNLVMKNSGGNNKTKGSQLETERGVCHMTGREFDCITGLLQGKTAKEIGCMLNITHRTVETHMVNIKRKLQCNFKNELINYIVNKTDFFEVMQASTQEKVQQKTDA